MEMYKYDLPAHWASRLLYGDRTGLPDGEGEKIEKFCKALYEENINPDPFICTDEPIFRKFHDAHYLGISACDCLTYTFIDLRK